MKIEYRLGTMADLQKICSIVKSAIVHMNQQNIFQWDDIYPDEEILQQDIERQQLFVGIADDQIAVFYVLNQECDEEYQNGKWKDQAASYYVIHRLCVNPEFQNQGIGKLTMEHIEQEVAAMGIRSIRLDAFAENPYALKLYRKLHYNTVGAVDWRTGRFFLMEKYLTVECPK